MCLLFAVSSCVRFPVVVVADVVSAHLLLVKNEN